MSVARRVLDALGHPVRPGSPGGKGRLPESLRASLAGADEDMLVLLEDLPATITYRHFRAYGEYSLWKREWTRGAIAITDQRLVVWAGAFLHIRFPHAHPLRARIGVSAKRADRVCFRYHAGITNPSLRGHVEVRLHTSWAAGIADLLSRLADQERAGP